MRKSLALMVVVTGLSGCSTVRQTSKETPGAKFAQQTPYASLTQDEQYKVLAAELKTVGVALQKYAWDHDGQLPPRLALLVSQGYLPASGLLSSADPSAGKEGGVPDSYSTWGQAAEADEQGSSYLYEFSAAACKWDWKSYIGGKPSEADVDKNRDGVVSWEEVKTWQLHHGDVTQQPASRPYARNRFPIVRCYWYQYPTAYANVSGRTVLNLAADLQTVFISQPWWEKDGQ